jgi:hypothetical protein
VHYFDAAKREHFQKAKAVVLSANGAATARLLLNSKSSRFPDGLANPRCAKPVHLRGLELRDLGQGSATLTIQALAFRAADHIGRFAGRNEV